MLNTNDAILKQNAANDNRMQWVFSSSCFILELNNSEYTISQIKIILIMV